MKYKTKIGKAVEKSGLKMCFIVDKTGISRPTLWRILSGKVEPKVNQVMKIAQVINIEVTKLI